MQGQANHFVRLLSASRPDRKTRLIPPSPFAYLLPHLPHALISYRYASAPAVLIVYHEQYRYAKETIPYGIKRYQDETARLYGVLETQLNEGKGEWLVGDKVSIVDFNGEPYDIHVF